MKALMMAACATALIALQAAANTLTFSAAKGGPVVAGVNYVNFDDLALGSSTQTATGPNGSVLVDPQFDARVVQGDVPGVYVPPLPGNNNGAFFGGQPDGADTTPYLTTGYPGSITLRFSSPQKYIGLIWGSPDPVQGLYFYADSLGFLGQVAGNDLLALGLYDDGIRSTYVNINSELPFDFVVAVGPVFEFDNLAYFRENVILPGESITLPPFGHSVPDAGSSAALLGLTAVGCVGIRKALGR